MPDAMRAGFIGAGNRGTGTLAYEMCPPPMDGGEVGTIDAYAWAFMRFVQDTGWSSDLHDAAVGQ